MSGDVLKKIGRLFGWFALIFIVLSVVSGFAWDVRTSNLVSTLTGGLLNRIVGIDLHTYVLIPLALTLVIHVILGVRSVVKETRNVTITTGRCRSRTRHNLVSDLDLEEA